MSETLEQKVQDAEIHMKELGEHIDALLRAIDIGLITKPSGIFWKKCPHDGTRLSKDVYNQYIYEIKHLRCAQCSYEYATKESMMVY